jgi:hypothetical protein
VTFERLNSPFHGIGALLVGRNEMIDHLLRREEIE